MSESTVEVIGKTDGLVVVTETSDYWRGVSIYTHNGCFSLDADELTSLINRLEEARQKILK